MATLAEMKKELKVTKLVDGWYNAEMRGEKVSLVRNNSKGWFATAKEGGMFAEEPTLKALIERLWSAV